LRFYQAAAAVDLGARHHLALLAQAAEAAWVEAIRNESCRLAFAARLKR
jgi:hypothetical protein